MRDLDAIMGAAPVIPVLVVDRLEDALPMARALVAGGLPVLEVTLRTPVALDAIRAMREVEGAVVEGGCQQMVIVTRFWPAAPTSTEIC